MEIVFFIQEYTRRNEKVWLRNALKTNPGYPGLRSGIFRGLVTQSGGRKIDQRPDRKILKRVQDDGFDLIRGVSGTKCRHPPSFRQAENATSLKGGLIKSLRKDQVKNRNNRG